VEALVRVLSEIDVLVRDVRLAVRGFCKSPGFVIAVLFTLTLGIGANTAIFSLIDALLLRKLPVERPNEIVQLTPLRPDGMVLFSYPMFREMERDQQVFSGLIGWSPGGMVNIEVDGTLAQDNVTAVTGSYYSLLGARPYLGRLIEPADASLNSGSPSQVAVLGYDFWRRRLGGSPEIVGKQIQIEGQPFTVVGITNRWFTGMSPGEPPEVIIPLTAQPLIQGNSNFLQSLEDRSFLWLYVAGRLKEKLTIGQAQAQLQSTWPGLLAATAPTQTPGSRLQRWLSMKLDVRSAAIGIAPELRNQFRRPLYVVLGVTGVILLVACVNLAGLMLARGAAHSREMSIRLAIGANRWTLVRQVLTENLVLSVGGALLGLLTAFWGANALVVGLTRHYPTPVLLDLRPDLRIVFVTAGVAVITGLLFGLVPAISASRSDPVSALSENSRSVVGRRGFLGKSLTVAQIALSFVLLIGAGLLVRTFQKLNSIDLGIDKGALVEVALAPRPNGYRDLDMNEYHRQLVARISAIPGVQSVSFSDVSLPRQEGWRDMVSPASMGSSGPMADGTTVAPLFLQTLGIRLVEGRDFDWNDDDRRPSATVVSNSLAKQLFPGRRAVGQHIRFGVFPEFQSLEVIGVADDARIFDIRNQTPLTVYLPSLQHSKLALWGNLFIRAGVSGGAFFRDVTREVESLGHEYVTKTQLVSEVTSDMLVTEQVTAALSGVFAALALLIACVGLYGLMSYTVTRRTKEIGVRAALGAQRGNILWLVLRQSIALSVLGIVFGVLCSLVTSRALASMVYGLSTQDPSIIFAVSIILFTTTLLAAYLPARRATRIEPMAALRQE
jgi:predicted permease